MTEVERGTRPHGEDHIFQEPSDDPTIHSDTVTPAVEGYFRVPPIWVGEEPNDASSLNFDPTVHYEVVIEKDLLSGIPVRILRDGTFLFDFSSWKIAPQIMIPGYRIANPHGPHRRPFETEKAEQDSEKYAVLRAQAMNVHQSCLTTAQWLRHGSSSGIGVPLAAADALKGLTFEQCLSYLGSEDNPRGLVRNAANNFDGVNRERAFPRYNIDIEVAERSLDLLDRVLLVNDAAVIQMLEAAYLAACRCSEGRLGEAITLAWGVCEQLLSKAWTELISDIRNESRMPKTRREKLNGRDYTASVMTEILELSGRIDYDLYVHLEQARKARNRWMHEMSEPETIQVLHAIKALQGLLHSVLGIQQAYPMHSPSPGVPEWFIWHWNAIGGYDVSD